MDREVLVWRNESIVLELPDGRPVVLTILNSTTPSLVRLGVRAPADVPVDREEVHQLKKQINNSPR